jgi:hypothetical protein
MSSKVINHLINSIESNNKDSNGNNYIHHSGIYKNGKPLYVGSNNTRNTYNGKCICFSTHAEMDVIQRVLKGQVRTAI